jgi:CheY-like chemotaxis protein
MLPRALAELCILVVDDDAASRELLVAIFRRAGATVLAAASVEAALETMRAHPPHLIVSDIAMPGQDGYALIRIVRDRAAEAGGLVPAIALTGFSSAREQQAALAAGFSAHLAKPIDANELLSTAERLARPRAPPP